MLRAKARTGKAVAFAAASISPSLPSISGKAMAARTRKSRTPLRHSSLLTGSQKSGRKLRVCSRGGLVMGVGSGFGRRRAAEEPGGAEHQHQNQDREDDHVGPAHGDELAAQGFDEADQQPAQHRAGDVADAAENGGGEGPEPRGVADDE